VISSSVGFGWLNWVHEVAMENLLVSHIFVNDTLLYLLV
jgi:hypothetical protein